MAKPKIFVSFDFEKDRQYKYTLNMWNSNPNFEFTCDDRSPSEIQTESVSVVETLSCICCSFLPLTTVISMV